MNPNNLKRFLSLLFCITTWVSQAQKDPLDWCIALFHTDGPIDTTGLYSASFDARPPGLFQLFVPDSIREDRSKFLPDFSLVRQNSFVGITPLSIDSDFTIVTITVRDTNDRGFDFYLHFKWEQEAWKLKALKQLNSMIAAELWMAQLSEKEADSIIESTSPQKILHSKEQYYYIRDLYHLSLQFDDSLVDYFGQNRTEINQIFERYEEKRKPKTTQNRIQAAAFEKLNPNQLLLTELEGIHLENADLVALYILNNYKGSIGFIKISDPSLVPRILEKNNLFLLREMEKDWYLFKGNGRR